MSLSQLIPDSRDMVLAENYLLFIYKSVVIENPPYVNTDRPKILRFFVNVNTDPGKLARPRREKIELFWPISRGKRLKSGST